MTPGLPWCSLVCGISGTDMRSLFITAFVVFLADQASKYWIVKILDLPNRIWVEVLPPYLNFRMAWNQGVNFGLFSGADMRWFLIALAVAVCLMVLWWVVRDGGGRLTHLSAGLLIGGALGNVVDRVVYGAVVDFLNMSCCGIENPYAFNVADIAIFAGAIGMILFSGKTKTP